MKIILAIIVSSMLITLGLGECLIFPNNGKYAFYQPSNYNVQLYDDAKWSKSLNDLKQMWVQNVIYQWSYNSSLSWDLETNLNILKKVSNISQNLGMNLVVWTYLPWNWFFPWDSWRDLIEFRNTNKYVWEQIQNNWICFSSWYIPAEIWIFEMSELNSQSEYKYSQIFSWLVWDLKLISNKPVSFSPYLSRFEYQAPNASTKKYSLTADQKSQWIDFINKSGFDIIFIQDGVWAQWVPVDFVPKYLKAVINLSKDTNVIKKPVSIIGLMEVFNPDYTPASVSRVKTQLINYLSIDTKDTKLAFFDYPHYVDKGVSLDLYNLLKSYFVK